jgi:kumamolisin
MKPISHMKHANPQRRVKCFSYLKKRTPKGFENIALHIGSWRLPTLLGSYHWPAGSASGGGVIAIVELGGGWVPADMDRFFASIGQPVPNIVDVSVDGTSNNSQQSPQNDADYEVALDIQVAAASYQHATGKPANIRVYWAQDIAPAVERAAADGCDVCSISWGNDEASWGNSELSQMETAAASAVKLGMCIFAASGDNDSSDGGPNSANVDAPASCPHVIGCGGTTKVTNSETVWNNDPGATNGEGTGGGFSTFFPMQSFQIGAPTPPKGLGRMVPDVAANADPNTGYEIVVYEQQQIIGGTSAVAPLYAGLIASFGKKLGFVTPKLFLNPGAFVDITRGGNGMYSALRGPDACSGLGAPNGISLMGLF